MFKRTAFTGYGDILAMTGDHPEPRDYIGERRDGATALLYLHARSYDARTAQFLSPDPSLPTLAGVGTNRYAYAGGDPMNRLDPSWLRWCLGWSRVDTDGRDGHEGKWEPYWYVCDPSDPVDLIHGPWGPPPGPGGPDGCLRLHTCREPPPKPDRCDEETCIKKPPPPKEPPPWEPPPEEQCIFWLGENCKYWDDRKHRRPEHVHPNPDDEIKPPTGIPGR